MKKFLTLIFVFLLTSAVFAENKPEKQREFGFSISSLISSFDLMYKVGNDHFKWRFAIIDIDGAFEFDDGFDFRIGGSIGEEYYKALHDSINFIYGYDLTYRSYYNDPKNMIKLNAVLGINAIIKNHFILGLEYDPYIYYYFYISGGVMGPYNFVSDRFGFEFAPAGRLSFAYRF